MTQSRTGIYAGLPTYPAEWGECPLSEMVDINPESLGNGTPGDFQFRYIDLSSVDRGVIHWDTVQEMTFRTAPSRARRVVREGDTLFGTVRPSLQSHAHIGTADGGPLVASTGFAVLRAGARTCPDFIKHLIFSEQVTDQVRRLETGSNYPAVNESDLSRVLVPHPPDEEQTRIAKVLNTLDESIRMTADIIAKRQVARQGLIRDLLTYGVDQCGQRRDPHSNPEEFVSSSLGMVPKTWTIKALSSCCLAVVDCPHSTPNFMDQGVLVARTMHIKEGRFETRLVSRVSEEEYQTRVSRIEPTPGDVIFTREAPVGEAFVIPEGMRICLGQRVMLLRPDPAVLLGDYLVSQIYSGAVQSRIKLLTGGTTNPHLNVAEVRAFPIPIPPIQEQEILVSYLQGFEHSLDAEKEQLRKLETLKSGLTSDLLSGRVRVPVGTSAC